MVVFPSGIELEAFGVLGGCGRHYTTETAKGNKIYGQFSKSLYLFSIGKQYEGPHY